MKVVHAVDEMCSFKRYSSFKHVVDRNSWHNLDEQIMLKYRLCRLILDKDKLTQERAQPQIKNFFTLYVNHTCFGTWKIEIIECKCCSIIS